MRKSAMSFFVFLLAFFTVATVAPSAEAEIFGRADCSATFPCSTYVGLMSGDPKVVALVSQADSCVKRYFGANVQEENFVKELGLDSNKCLKSKPGKRPAAQNTAPLTPKCCIVQRNEGICVLHCDLITGD